MLKIDITIKINDLIFPFKADVERGRVFTFDIGEQVLADKLFYVLVGLDGVYEGVIESDEVDFSYSKDNSVLAIGDKTMFISGSVYHNVYKALRARFVRKEAHCKTREALERFNLTEIGSKKINTLNDDELLSVAIARASFRNFNLMVVNCCESYVQNINEIMREKNFTNFNDKYIIKIT